MSPATLRAPRAKSHSFRSRLRLTYLEDRITPSIDFPDFVALPVPQSSYTFPSGGGITPLETYTPPITTSYTPSAQAPTIAEWTRTGQKDQTLAVTGHQMSAFLGNEAGNDTEFMVFGQVSTESSLLPATTLRIDGSRAAVTLPDSKSFIEHSMYVMWPANSYGAGRPVRINAPEVTWIGPNTAAEGETVTVYGSNLNRQGSSSQDTWVYIETESGTPLSNPWVHVTASESNPYQVTFTMPDISADTTYHIRIHTGQGGKYGFSEKVELVGRAPLPGITTSVGKFDVTESQFGATINNNADDDSVGIQEAVVAAADYVEKNSGHYAVVYFPAGTYAIEKSIDLYNRHHIRLEGVADTGNPPGDPLSIIQPNADSKSVYPATLFISSNQASDLRFTSLTLKGTHSTMQKDGSIDPTLVRIRNDSAIEGLGDIQFHDVTFDANGYRLFPLDLTGYNRITIQDCHFNTGGHSHLVGMTQVRIDNNHFRGRHNVEYFFEFSFSGEISITGNTFQDYDDKSTKIDDYAGGRIMWAQGAFNENYYIGNNTSIDLAPEPYFIETLGEGYLNRAEQIGFEPSGPNYYGQPVAATETSVTFDDLAVNYLTTQGRLTASIIDGKGLGQRRKVTDINLSTGVVTVEPAWNIIPDATSTISLAPAQQNVVIYSNTLDGKEEWMAGTLVGSTSKDGKHVASSAIQVHGVAHFIIDSNTIRDVRNGVYMFPVMHVDTGASGNDPRPLFDTDFFNYIANNSITNACKGIAITTGPPAFASGYADVGYGAAELGTTVRNNTFAAMKKLHMAGQRSYSLGTEISHQYRGADLTIFEDYQYPAVSGWTEDAGLWGVDISGYYDSNTHIRSFATTRSRPCHRPPSASTLTSKARRPCSTTTGAILRLMMAAMCPTTLSNYRNASHD